MTSVNLNISSMDVSVIMIPMTSYTQSADALDF